MKRFFLTVIVLVVAAIPSFAALELTASSVTVKDLTVDKYNFFVTVEAHTSSGGYEIAFDLWPASRSAIGAFSAKDKTIGYVSSFVHKVSADGKPVDMWYSCMEDSEIDLSVTALDDHTCTLSGSIQASRNDVTYTYRIAPFTFAYSEEQTEPVQDKDPYRFEPAQPATIDFSADVVHFRQRDGFIEITLAEMANETYDWMELALISDRMAMPAGTYELNDSGQPGSLRASRGYLGTQEDDPSYLAIRGDKDNWGSYTPYYLESGTINVTYNSKGDSISITGTVSSHNGSVIHISTQGYNMLYEPTEELREPEDVTLDIDTVVITYMSNLSDSLNNRFVYTLNFSRNDDYPNVLADVVMTHPMTLVEGTYTLSDGTLSGLMLSQNQKDFETNIFIGSAYEFVDAELCLTALEDTRWRFDMTMHDAIGSTYRFKMTQTPRIVLYPQPETDPKDKPFADESRIPETVDWTFDILDWKTTTVDKDGIIDIILGSRNPLPDGLFAYVHLGMYTPSATPEAGTYPVSDSEADGTFSASPGRYGNTIIPSYAMTMDSDGWTHAVWFITAGSINLSYTQNGEPVIEGDCTSYFGSGIRFRYLPATEGMKEIQPDKAPSSKIVHNGQLYIIYNGQMYDLRGGKVKDFR